MRKPVLRPSGASVCRWLCRAWKPRKNIEISARERFSWPSPRHRWTARRGRSRARGPGSAGRRRTVPVPIQRSSSCGTLRQARPQLVHDAQVLVPDVPDDIEEATVLASRRSARPNPRRVLLRGPPRPARRARGRDGAFDPGGILGEGGHAAGEGGQEVIPRAMAVTRSAVFMFFSGGRGARSRSRLDGPRAPIGGGPPGA